MGEKKAREKGAQSRPIPFRIGKENDAYVQRLQRQRQLNNRNQMLNVVIEEHRTLFEVYRQRMKAKAQKLMDDWNLKPSDFLG